MRPVPERRVIDAHLLSARTVPAGHDSRRISGGNSNVSQPPYEPASGSVQSPDHPHGQQAPGYGAPAYGAPGYGAPGFAPAPQRTNVMAILGLVFAFVFSPLGIVFSAIGLSQTKKRGEGGRGLAIAGLILSIVFLLIGLLVFFLAFAAFQQAVETGAIAETEVLAPAEESLAAQPADAQGVLAACQTIGPAMVTFESDMAAVATPEDYVLAITEVRTAIETAAATTTDPVFVADVQLLSDNLQLAADTVAAGEDPTYLEAALTEDGTRIDMDCAAAGYTGP
jgi:Domain of unknown function (DUF4190)